MGYAVADGHVRFHIAGMSGKKLDTTRRQTRCQEIAWKLLYQSDVRGLALFLYFGDAMSHERAQTTCHTHRDRAVVRYYE